MNFRHQINTLTGLIPQVSECGPKLCVTAVTRVSLTKDYDLPLCIKRG